MEFANKLKINLIGGGFQHALPQINEKTTLVEWVINDPEAKLTFYVDHSIMQTVETLPGTKNYGWLSEAKSIIPQVYEWAKDNASIISNKFTKIFTHSVELANQSSIFQLTQCSAKTLNNFEGDVYTKTKLVSFISSNKCMCEMHKTRLALVERYKNKCDLYGRGFNYIENKIDGLKDYCFSFAIENDTYPNMFTEKIVDCFMAGTIPIYLGMKNIGDFFNKDGIIIVDDEFNIENLSFELYVSKIKAVEENFKIAKSLLLAEDYICKNFLYE